MTAWDLTLELADRLDREPPRELAFQTIARDGAPPSISVGGSALADVVVTGCDAIVHCHLVVDDAGSVRLRDAGGRAGLTVNGAIVDGEVAFGHDDRLVLGDTFIRLVAVAPSELTWKLSLRVTGRGVQITPAGRGPEADLRVFHQAQVIVGRASTADLAIKAGNLSRKHCMFRVDDQGRVWVKDLGSTNGIHLRGVRVDHAIFSLDDKLYLGDCRIELAEPPKRVPR